MKKKLKTRRITITVAEPNLKLMKKAFNTTSESEALHLFINQFGKNLTGWTDYVPRHDGRRIIPEKWHPEIRAYFKRLKDEKQSDPMGKTIEWVRERLIAEEGAKLEEGQVKQGILYRIINAQEEAAT